MTSISPSSMNASCVSSRSRRGHAAVVRAGAHAALGERVRRAPRSRAASSRRRCPGPGACATTQSSSARVLRSASWWRSTASRMFGRSNPRTMSSGVLASRARCTMSARTGGAAVAVSARIGGRPSARDRRGEAQVLGAEVVAPLRHAVRLVDDEQRRVRRREPVRDLVVRELLGREQHELDARRPRGPRAPARARRATASSSASPRRRPRTPATASIWSSCSEMSGETTIVGPSSSRPASW